MENLIEENGITYELKGEIYYPLLKMPEQADCSFGKCGEIYVTLLTIGKLYEHLHEVDERVRGRVRKIMAELAGRRGIAETLKSTDLMRWVQDMNNCKAVAEEEVLREAIYK